MNAAGFLVPPHVEGRTQEQAQLWDMTFERIGPFLPELKGELFPAPRVSVPFEGESRPGVARQASAGGVGQGQMGQAAGGVEGGQEQQQQQGEQAQEGGPREEQGEGEEGVQSVLGL